MEQARGGAGSDWAGMTGRDEGVASGGGGVRLGWGTCGMAREQLLQVYSMTAYSWPSSSISFCKGTRDKSKAGRIIIKKEMPNCQQLEP